MTKEELHRAVEEMSEEQLRRILRLIESERGAAKGEGEGGGKQRDLMRFSGVMELREEPVEYQDRSRSEWK